jgi:hypothetical protein
MRPGNMSLPTRAACSGSSGAPLARPAADRRFPVSERRHQRKVQSDADRPGIEFGDGRGIAFELRAIAHNFRVEEFGDIAAQMLAGFEVDDPAPATVVDEASIELNMLQPVAVANSQA